MPRALARSLVGLALLLGATTSACSTRKPEAESEKAVPTNPADRSPQADPEVDSTRAARASIVVRARLLSPGGGSKFLWDSVEVLRLIKNQTGTQLPTELLVAHYSTEPGIPAGSSTVYLEPYGDGTTGRWQLLDGSARLGVSHPTP